MVARKAITNASLEKPSRREAAKRHLHVYIRKEVADELDRCVEKSGRTRKAIIERALEAWFRSPDGAAQ